MTRYSSNEETLSDLADLDGSAVEREYRKVNKKPFWFSLLVAFVIIFIARWSIISPYYVPTGSMNPTVQSGDRLLGYKLAYGLTLPFQKTPIYSWAYPVRGDIVIFRNPHIPSLYYVKRVVGIPGDKVQVIGGILYLNDKPVSDETGKEVIYQKSYQLNFDSDNDAWFEWGPIKIDEDKVFVLSDKRSDTNDSRSFGVISRKDIIAKALCVLWSDQQVGNGDKEQSGFRKDRVLKGI